MNYTRAFPFMEVDSDGDPYQEHLGLTKREYFAGLALQGILSTEKTLNILAGAIGQGESPEQAMRMPANVAMRAADALLKALEGK